MQVRPGVLLVDDLHANLLALEGVISDLGCDVVRARSGDEALSRLLQRDFALMLVDVQMPGMDGYEVVRRAMERPRTHDMPVIFLTAMNPTEVNVLRSYGSGAVDVLFKPLNPDVLRSKVRVFLDLYIGRRKLADEVKSHERTLGELQQTNAALRHFTHAASHDLKAPLRAVQGFLRALSEDVGEGLEPRAREYVERSHRASERMLELLDSLLAYARLQTPLLPTELDCDALMEQARNDLADRIIEAKATFEIAPLPSVRGDASRIYQLFLNLLGNGIKFARPNVAPVVKVTAEDDDREVVFHVADNGVGIAPRDLDKIFEPFRRLHAQDRYDGSGLGLTICQQIIEQHGGRIWVTSSVGVGTQFHFNLPK